MNFSLKYLRFGANSILVEWPEAIQKKILIDSKNAIKTEKKIKYKR